MSMKKGISILLSVLIVICISLTAFAEVNSPTSNSGKNQTDKGKTDLSGKQSTGSGNELAKLIEKAKELNIDTNGLTAEEIKARIIEELNSLNEAPADSSTVFNALLKALSGIKQNKSADLKSAASLLDDALSKDYPGLAQMSAQKLREVFIEVFQKYLGINVLKSSVNSAKVKINEALLRSMKEEATYYKVDIKGLSLAAAERKLDKAREKEMEKNWADLKEYAAKVGVNISGLSFEEAWKKVKETEMNKFWAEINKQAKELGIDITGLSMEDAAKKLKEASFQNMVTKLLEEAKKLGIDLTGITATEKSIQWAKNKLEIARKAIEQKGKDDLVKMAKKFNVDITGLSEQEAWAKVKQAEKNFKSAELIALDEQHMKELLQRAQSLGVDITGLSFEEAFKNVEAANDAANWQGVLRAAADYGVDVSGLTLEQAEAKIRQARAVDQGVNISGLSPQEAEALLQSTKNNQMTPEGILLQNTCSLLGLNTNATVAVSRSLVSAKLGINLSGLSLEDEAKAIQAALEKLGLKLP